VLRPAQRIRLPAAAACPKLLLLLLLLLPVLGPLEAGAKAPGLLRQLGGGGGAKHTWVPTLEPAHHFPADRQADGQVDTAGRQQAHTGKNSQLQVAN
jgi:hypothetical protein